ncbi:MAG: hypothetical protein TE42_09765 [Candidatus Synechococcus spongiarum SP3]|uniref:Dephospho-CoA kinase n=1 Tax=Candidatus Synechococcus spongiarum SP3 TaxID=1604020 RepID=A0A0G2J429_9SYNE|nr:MAG: hypothetical protein TE42_09765 [Candidatus Synechococcus spongiarum SP3]
MTPEPGHPRRRWRGPQRHIGLTGGIATGKSTVAAIFQNLPTLRHQRCRNLFYSATKSCSEVDH